MNNKFAIRWFFSNNARPTVTRSRHWCRVHTEEAAMFIFNRPFRAVAAGLGVALLFVSLDRSCQPLNAATDGPPAGNGQAVLVPVTPLRVSSPPVRDLSLSCRLPPA
jgi:hypothetical protein